MSDSSSLLKLVETSSNIEELLIQSGGELTPEIEAALATVDIQLPEKVDGYALVMDRMTMLTEFYKGRADMFLRLAKAAAVVTERCKDNLKFAMEQLGTEELLGNDMRFKLQKSPPSCVIEDEAALDGSYKITEVITKIDKKRIAEDLKLGVPVRGARLEQGTYVRPYANTPAKKKAVSK